MTTGDRHDELRSHLQGRIPNPAPGYWEDIDERLARVERDQDHAKLPDTDVSAVRLTDMEDNRSENDPAAASKGEWWRNGKVLAAAALLLVVGLGAVAIANRSSDDSVDLATATEQPADGASADTDATDGSGEVGDEPATDANEEPANGEIATGGDTTTGPLTAIQARLGGEEGAGSAGPYCFTSDDAYVFPANELEDRRALARVDVSFDGFVDLFALQGDLILISASGYPNEAGVLSTRPFAEAGGSGELPPYTIAITDSSIAFSPEGPPLDLVPCESVQDRVEQIFTLLNSVGPVDNGVDWPASDAVLSSAGLGPIRIGMAVSELSAQLGTTLVIQTIDGNTAGACGSVETSDSISNAVWILVELTSATDGIIRRVSVTDGRWLTPSGMSVGVTEQTIIDTFPGQIESSPHLYVEGTYLTYQPTNANDPNTVQFVNEGGTIVDIRVGDRNWVGLVEGCA